VDKPKSIFPEQSTEKPIESEVGLMVNESRVTCFRASGKVGSLASNNSVNKSRIPIPSPAAVTSQSVFEPGPPVLLMEKWMFVIVTVVGAFWLTFHSLPGDRVNESANSFVAGETEKRKS